MISIFVHVKVKLIDTSVQAFILSNPHACQLLCNLLRYMSCQTDRIYYNHFIIINL